MRERERERIFVSCYILTFAGVPVLLGTHYTPPNLFFRPTRLFPSTQSLNYAAKLPF